MKKAGAYLLRIIITLRPIANKYSDGNMKSNLKKWWKVPETCFWKMILIWSVRMAGVRCDDNACWWEQSAMCVGCCIWHIRLCVLVRVTLWWLIVRRRCASAFISSCKGCCGVGNTVQDLLYFCASRGVAANGSRFLAQQIFITRLETRAKECSDPLSLLVEN